MSKQGEDYVPSYAAQHKADMARARKAGAAEEREALRLMLMERWDLCDGGDDFREVDMIDGLLAELRARGEG